MRRAICILISAAVIVTCGACCGPRWQYNWYTFRFERIGPRDKHRQTAGTTARAPQPAGNVAQEPVAPKKRTGDGRDYRLYFTAGAEVADLPAENVFVVRSAPVAKLAELIGLLYPGLGPGGRPEVQYIIYSDIDVWRSARGFAEQLDTRASDTGSAGDMWRQAIDGLYASAFPRKLERQKRLRIVKLLNRVGRDRSANHDVRWAAAIIKSHLFVRYDPKDYSVAGAALAEAGKTVQHGDYRAMVVRYHHIKQLVAGGRKRDAVTKARRTLKDYAQFRNTSCYGMIRAAAR